MKEFFLFLGASDLGLLFNFIFLYILVDFVAMHTIVLETVAKICSIGIVFLWNFMQENFLFIKNKKVAVKTITTTFNFL